MTRDTACPNVTLSPKQGQEAAGMVVAICSMPIDAGSCADEELNAPSNHTDASHRKVQVCRFWMR